MSPNKLCLDNGLQILHEGDHVILSDPSSQYEAWRDVHGIVQFADPDYVDIRLISEGKAKYLHLTCNSRKLRVWPKTLRLLSRKATAHAPR